MPWTTSELGDAQIEPGKPRYPLKAGSASWERMNFSAALSSSFVVTPGRTLPASIRRQRTRMSPEAAILSSCSGVLRVIIRYNLDRLVPLPLQRGQRPAYRIGDVLGRGCPVDPSQHAL